MSDYADGGFLMRLKRFFHIGSNRQEPEETGEYEMDGIEIELEDFSDVADSNHQESAPEQQDSTATTVANPTQEQQTGTATTVANPAQEDAPAIALNSKPKDSVDSGNGEMAYYDLDQTTDRGRLVKRLIDMKPKAILAANEIRGIKPPQEEKEEKKQGEKQGDKKEEEKKPHPKMDKVLESVVGLEKAINAAIKALVEGESTMRHAMIIKGCGVNITNYLLALQHVDDLTADELKLISTLGGIDAEITKLGTEIERDFLVDREAKLQFYFIPIINKLTEIQGDEDSKSENFAKLLDSVSDLAYAYGKDENIDMYLATAIGYVNAYLEKVNGNRYSKKGKRRKAWAEEMKYLLTLASGISWDVGQGREIPQVNLEEDAPEHEDKEKKESDKGDVKPEKKPDSGDTLMKESDIETIYWDLAGLVQDSHTVEAAQEMFDKYGDNEADSAYYRTLYDICEKLVNSERYHIDAPELVERFKQYEKQFIIGKAKPRHKKMKRKGKKYKKAK